MPSTERPSTRATRGRRVSSRHICGSPYVRVRVTPGSATPERHDGPASLTHPDMEYDIVPCSATDHSTASTSREEGWTARATAVLAATMKLTWSVPSVP